MNKRILFSFDLLLLLTITSCTKVDIKYMCMNDFLKREVSDGLLKGAIKFWDSPTGFNDGYMLFVKNNLKEELFLYYDRTFLVNKFGGPYKLELYPYDFSIDEICNFIY